MAGEDAQETGRDGLRRAKRWLEFTTRVDQAWTHRDLPLAELLQFDWPYGGGGFSFDLGGTFRGGELDSQPFLAEVKTYKREGDLPTHFRDFLAKCYVALMQHPERCGHFLWISWAPFQAQKWDEHTTAANVQKSILHAANCMRTLGVAAASEGRTRLDPELLTHAAEKAWLVTLGDKQERLVLSQEHYLEVVRLITERGLSS